MCSRNTVREISHISFFCRGDPYCELARRPENTHEEMTGLLEWPAGLCLPPERSVGLSPWLERPGDLSFSPQLQTLYCLFKSHADIWISSSPTYFSVYCWLSELTYFRFFPVICWSYLWMEISVTLSIGNKSYSRHHILNFSFLWKPLCWCYLATALNLLSSSTALCR